MSEEKSLFPGLKQVEERMNELRKQLEVLYQEQEKLRKVIEKLEAEWLILSKMEHYIRGEYNIVFER